MVLNILAKLAQFLIVAVSVKIMTHLLNESEIGYVALLQVTVGIFSTFLISPIGLYLNKNTPKFFYEKTLLSFLKKYNIYIIAVGLISTILVPLIFNILQIFGLNIEIYGYKSYIIISLLIIFTTITQTYLPTINIIGKQNIYSQLIVLNALLSLVGSIVIIYQIGLDRGQSWLIGLIVSQMFMSILAIYTVNKIVKNDNPMKIKFLEIIKFSVPISIIGIAILVQGQGYKYFIAEKFGLAEFGLVMLGFGIAASLMGALEQIFLMLFQPKFYQESASGRIEDINEAWSEYATLIISGMTLGLFGLVAVSPDIVYFLVNKSFGNIAIYVIYGGIIEIFRIYISVISLKSQVDNRTRKLLFPYFSMATIFIISLYLSVDYFQAAAIPFSATISSIVGILILLKSLDINKKSTEKIINNIKNIILWSFLLGAPLYLYRIYYEYEYIYMNLLIDAIIFISIFFYFDNKIYQIFKLDMRIKKQ